MKTTFTTQHNAASTLNGSHAAHNVYSPLRRLGMLAILLVTFVLGVRAQNYYVFRNANGYYIYNNNGTVGATQTFSPACVWRASGTMGNTSRSLQSYVNTSQYLYGTTSSISIGTSQSRWRKGGEYLRYYQNNQNRVYVNYGSSGWYFQNAASTTEGFKVLSVTINERAGSGTTTYSTPTVTLSPTSVTVAYPESVTFEANASASITKRTTGQPAYTTFTFDGETYYYEGTSGNFGEALSGVPEANTTTNYALQGYRYTLSGDVEDYLSGNSTSGSITYTTLNPTVDAVTGSMVVTPVYENEEELTGITMPKATASITLKRQVLPAYSITSVEDLEYMATNPSRDYVVEADFDASGFSGTITNFSGTFDGQYYVISGLTRPLFTSANGATIKNVVLDDVNIYISGTGNVGGIVATASGATRIYNCGVRATNGSTIGGGTNTGSIVGELNGNARVVNCYSFADISGTTNAAGIVGRLSGSTSSGGSFATQTYSMSSTNGWTMNGVNNANTGNRVFEVYAGWGSLNTRSGEISRTVSLPAGTYKLTGKALYRQGQNYNTNSTKSLGYMFAGTSRVLVPTLASANLGNNSPNSMEAAANAFYNQGLYTCELTFTLNASQSIELGYECTHDAAYSWFIAGEMTLEQTSNANNGNAMVMNCMYYGKLSGTNNYPIYGGNEISNVRGTNTYNYYRLNAGYTNNYDYGCAQPISDDSYLTRFDFYRHILNSHRELAAIYCFDDVDQYEEIDKWVLDTEIAAYPIIKEWTPNTRKTLDREIPVTAEAYAGKQVGSVNATVVINGRSYNATLPITDMDTARWDYTYGKVVLPFANEFTGWTPQAVGNTSIDRIITGWEITSMTGGTQGQFTTTGDNRYNFADPECKAKDLYANNGNYVYAQGGNLVIPKGVTAITITAHWADCVYLRDAYYDLAYDQNYANTRNIGTAIGGQYNGKTVYTDLSDAIERLPGGKDKMPADQAIVLVGNYHYNQEVVGTEFNGDKPYTIMSIDRDKDQEPDYCWYSYHTTDRTPIGPHRFDFVTNVGLGMAARVKGSTPVPTIGIWHSRGWSEYTETYLGLMTECEINSSYFDGYYGGTSPWIANGGIYHQIVHSRGGAGNQLGYIRIGGNAYIKQFYPGNHDDNAHTTTLSPVNVCGGEIEQCYMTGRKSDAATIGSVFFWCNGGYLHEFLGAYMEPVNGSVTAKIDHALIDNFYGGGANANRPVTGNIDIAVNNSYVDFFCGGPKVGNMNEGTRINITAEGTTFGEFYGGGYGGTALTRIRTDQNANVQFNQDKEFPLPFANYVTRRLEKNGDVNEFGTGYGFEYFLYSGGTGIGVARFYVDFASLSLATVRQVTSRLNNCTILKDFYGGGCQSRVDGNASSTLTNCRVYGNVFGGGYTATATPCVVYPAIQPAYSTYIKATGAFTDFEQVTPDTCYWVQVTNLTAPYVNINKKEIYTTEDMSVMGEVSGNTTVYVGGASQVDGGVYGGGNMSRVKGTTQVTIESADTYRINEVYGGANRADVGNVTTVNILSGKVGNVFGTNNQSGIKSLGVTVNVQGGTSDYVYGAGNKAAYTGSPLVNMQSGTVRHAIYGGGLGETAVVTGNPQVNMTGGTVGYIERVNDKDVVRGGDVFGGGNAAAVEGNTNVHIAGGEVKRNVYGGGNQAKVTGKTNVVIGQ